MHDLAPVPRALPVGILLVSTLATVLLSGCGSEPTASTAAAPTTAQQSVTTPGTAVTTTATPTLTRTSPSTAKSTPGAPTSGASTGTGTGTKSAKPVGYAAVLTTIGSPYDAQLAGMKQAAAVLGFPLAVSGIGCFGRGNLPVWPGASRSWFVYISTSSAAEADQVGKDWARSYPAPKDAALTHPATVPLISRTCPSPQNFKSIPPQPAPKTGATTN